MNAKHAFFRSYITWSDIKDLLTECEVWPKAILSRTDEQTRLIGDLLYGFVGLQFVVTL